MKMPKKISDRLDLLGDLILEKPTTMFDMRKFHPSEDCGMPGCVAGWGYVFFGHYGNPVDSITEEERVHLVQASYYKTSSRGNALRRLRGLARKYRKEGN